MDDKKTARKRTRRIIEIIVIIIIILLLITCCTSKYWGRIGSIDNDKTVEIDDSNGDKEIVLNKNLQFYHEKYTMYLSDKDLKLGFYYQKLNPREFSCYTSDANVATCYVQNGYVVINPKQEGFVKVYVESEVNGKIYRAKSDLEIKASKSYLKVSKNKVTINLKKNAYAYVSYSLIGIEGEVKLQNSNKQVLMASIKDGILTLKGLKKGNSEVTLSVTYNNQVYEVVIKVTITNKAIAKDSDSYLKSLTVSTGNLKFNKKTTKYNVKVDKTTDKLSLKAVPNSNKAKVSYNFNGDIVDNLNNLKLKVGENRVTITVEAENGSITTYTVVIIKEGPVTEENNNFLSAIESNVPLNEKFQKDQNHYTLTVPFATSLNLKGMPVDNKSEVTYHLNGKVVNAADINKYLQNGENELEITVKDQAGQERKYTIDIFKKYRVLVLADESLEAEIDGFSSYTIEYKIYEYNANNESQEIGDYELKDVTVTIPGYDGKITINKGGINLIPKTTIANKDLTLEAQYYDSQDTISLHFTKKYNFAPDTNKYEVYLSDNNASGSIVLNNSFFSKEPRIEKNGNKICLYDWDNAQNYICLTANSSDLTFGNVTGSNSLGIEFFSQNAGVYNVQIEGYVNGELLKKQDLVIEVSVKFILTIHPNGGFLVDKDNYAYEEDLTFALTKDESFNLGDYTAYFTDKENCYYYELESFNTLSDGQGTKYPKNEILTLTSNLELYVIYSGTDYTQDVEVTKRKYLVLEENENIFYSTLYNKKMIYPGIYGTYTISVLNETANDLEITGLTLEEESVCVANGCLNMQYQIPNYLANYTSLYPTDGLKEVPFSSTLKLAPNYDIKIPLNWKWIDNDRADTAIGNKAYEYGELSYNLTISLDFKEHQPYCSLEEKP